VNDIVMVEKSRLPVIGGVLQIVLAFVCMFFSVIAIGVFLSTMPSASHWTGLGWLSPTWCYMQLALGIVGLAAFAFGLTGGILALKRSHFYLTIVGPFVIVAWSFLLIEHVALTLLAWRSYNHVTGLMLAFLMIMFAILSLTFIAVSKKEFA